MLLYIMQSWDERLRQGKTSEDDLLNTMGR